MHTHLFARCFCLLYPPPVEYCFSLEGSPGPLFFFFFLRNLLQNQFSFFALTLKLPEFILTLYTHISKQHGCASTYSLQGYGMKLLLQTEWLDSLPHSHDWGTFQLSPFLISLSVIFSFILSNP